MQSKEQEPLAAPVCGKTYSLFGEATHTEGYYAAVSRLADAALARCPDAGELLATVSSASRSKRAVTRLARSSGEESLSAWLLGQARPGLSPYLLDVEGHLGALPFKARWDRILASSREQYLLYMLEIELCDRLFAERFRASARKLAFLPHCLRDLSRECRSEVRGLDYVCKRCSKTCWVRAVSDLLEDAAVEPYIWMGANLKRLFREIKRGGESLGVLGIACVPELVNGLRLCRRHGVPAVGVPLDANRCARWMGEFYPNSVDLAQVRRLAGRGVTTVIRNGQGRTP